MTHIKKFLGIVGFAIAALASSSQSAFASCPGYTSIHICPAGGFEYEFHVPPHGCGHFSPPSVSLPSFVNHDRILERCERNNFPRYRRFTHEEGAALDALVETPEYLERMDWPYGALSLWVEDQLTGNVSPGWAGRQTILDAYRINAQARTKLATFRVAKRREKEAAARLQTAFSAALPNLITHARTSEKVGVDRAIEAADIAYLLHFDDRIHEARNWLKVSFEALDARSEEERDIDTPTIVEAISVCVESTSQEREALCRNGGVYQFARDAYACVLTSKVDFCDALVGWPREPEALAVAIRDKRASDPLFKKLFDRASFYQHINYRGTINSCKNHRALGLKCNPRTVPQVNETVLTINMPDLAAKIKGYDPRDSWGTLARQLFDCEQRGQSECLGANTKLAIEKGRKMFPEFSEVYLEYRDEEILKLAEHEAVCAVKNVFSEPGWPCPAEPTSTFVDRESQIFRDKFERVQRRSLDARVVSLARCRLRVALGSDQSVHCLELLDVLKTPDAVEDQLRSRVANFDLRYAEAFEKAIASTAALLGRWLAEGELCSAEKNINPSLANWPTAQERAGESRLEAVELVRLYPQTRDMIEEARLSQLKYLTTPR